jgi:murein DD-endopeptidase MepM/ murein hydrolase activator NlpD
MKIRRTLFEASLALVLLATACAPGGPVVAQPTEPLATMTPDGGPTPLPTRTLIEPGSLVSYAAQNGDTLPGLASHFNTTVDEILSANPAVPASATTLPPGYPMQIPAYNLPLTGSPFKIIPDSELVNGPAVVGFDLRQEILKRPGFLSGVTEYAFGRERKVWDALQIVADNYSINPRLMLALLEYRSQALSDPFPNDDHRTYPLGHRSPLDKGVYRQLNWAAEQLNNGYYGWRDGSLREFETTDGYIVRPDPWQNAGSVAVMRLFAAMDNLQTFEHDTSPDGLYATYVDLWGDPFARAMEFIPANLEQPRIALPFLPNRVWDFTGGPHPTWGESLPFGALDFAPPAAEGGCAVSSEWVAAPVDGVITRSEEALVELDLDGDGDARTGWVLIFFHMATNDRVAAGTVVKQGDMLGHPSCEGGRATGTHVHVARRFNGEWLPAGGVMPFTLDGWVAHAGDTAYQGTLTKASNVIQACTCTSRQNRIIYTPPGQ